MADTPDFQTDHAPLDEAPTWIRVLQAAAIGLVAGLALNALLSLTLQGEGLGRRQTEPKTCKKQAPAKDAVAPPTRTPAVSSVTWVFEGLLAKR